MDLNDYPTTEPRALPWKPIVFIAGGVVFIAVLVVVVIQLVRKSDEEALLQQAIEASTRSVLVECEQAQDPENCRQAELTEVAERYASSQTCEQLASEEARDNCYWGIARSVNDPAVCSSITDQVSSIRCADGVYEQLAIELNDRSVCLSIQDEEKRTRCERLLSDPLTSAQCVREEGSTLCDDLALFEKAQEEKSRDSCDTIVDEGLRDDCLEWVFTTLSEEGDQSQVDTDDDGLTDAEEATYMSDPENPDTDGDGYQDGQEVAAGYNPIGPGRLD